MSIKSVCPQCGMSVDDKISFCPTCGSKMNVVDEPSETAANLNEDMNNTYGSENSPEKDPFVFNNESKDNEPKAESNPAFDAAMNNNSNTNNSGNAPDLDSVMNGGNNFDNTSKNGSGIPPIPPVYNQPNMGMGNGNVPPIQFGMNTGMPPMPQPNKLADTMALVGMILGIVSICLCCFNLLDLPVAIAGLVLGILGVKSTKRKGMAIAGIVCSAIAILLCIAVFINGLEYSSNVSDLEDILRAYEEIYD